MLGERGGVEVGVWGDLPDGPNISYRGESAVGVPGERGGVLLPLGDVSPGNTGAVLGGGPLVRVKLRLGGSTLAAPGSAL